MVGLEAQGMVSPNHQWYDDWEYKQLVFHTETAYVGQYGKKQRISLPAKTAGEWFFYKDDLLWIYAGRLITPELQSTLLDWMQRLYDIVSMGDSISRIRAMMILSYLDDESDNIYGIAEIWANAQSWMDTLNVSKTVLLDEDFAVVKRACLGILRSYETYTDESPYILSQIKAGGKKVGKKNTLPAVVIQNPTQRNILLQNWFDGIGEINDIPLKKVSVEPMQQTNVSKTTSRIKPNIRQKRT